MSVPNQRDQDPYQMIASLQAKVDELERTMVSRWGRVPILTADPTSPPDGSDWIRSDTADLRFRSGGVTYPLTPAPGADLLINGCFDIWQRGSTGTGAAYTFVADRWQMVRNAFAAGFTVSKIYNPFTTFGKALNVYVARLQRDVGNASTATCYLNQNIESVNSIQAAGQTVTLSFYAYAGANWSAGANFRALIRSGTANDQNDLSLGFTGGVTVATQNCTITPAVQRFTVTGVVPAGSGELAVRLEFDPTGVAGAADYVEVTGVKLEIGAVATPVALRNEATVLAQCQRYYYQTGGNVGFELHAFGTAYNAAAAVVFRQHPVQMRAIPTVAFPSGTGAGGAFRLVDGTAAVASNGPLVLNADTSVLAAGIQVPVAAGLTLFRPYYLESNSTLTGIIAYNAEI